MRSDENNPFAAPVADVVVPEEKRELFLAERGTRLAAAMVDGLLALAAFAPSAYIAVVEGRVTAGSSPFVFFSTHPVSIVSTTAWAALVLFQAYLVTTTGQSIGKRWLGIRIVKMDGSPAGFLHGVGLRTWIFAMVQYIPVVGSVANFVSFVDVLFIFGESRRCLHDLLAGTQVVVAEGASGRA
jgi:uncharacterized RDD family membrane protein YckC